MLRPLLKSLNLENQICNQKENEAVIHLGQMNKLQREEINSYPENEKN
jgi:hypothetical protein